MERRIAAIFAADMVGYSRLMEVDEDDTLARQKRHRVELIDPTIEAHGGTIIKLTGDGMIADFPSVVEAVRCAVSVQNEMDTRETDEPEDRRIRYRIAINLGDVIFDEGDVYGDGVNIAARLEAIAPPGGVIVSGEAYNHLKNKVDVGYRDLGPQKLKNISTPVRAFEVTELGVNGPAHPRRGGKILTAAIALFLVVGIGLWSWQAGWFTGSESVGNRGPRIAVLPFDRLDKKEDDGFADGLTEDIITRLSYFDDLQVVARNSSFQYRGDSVDVREVGRELNANFVLEGSVRSGSGRVRVTAQLIDAKTGDHVWAETYDRELNATNIFEVQDDIVASIAAAIGGTSGEIARKILSEIKTSRPKFLSGYECLLLSRYITYSTDIGRYPDVVDCLRTTVENDPEYSDGWAATAGMIFLGLTYGADAGENPIPRMYEAAERAISTDPKNSGAHYALATAHFLSKRREEAISSFLHALKLAEHDPDAMSMIAFYLVHLGEFDVAKPILDRALELTPNPPPTLFIAKTAYHYSKKEFDQALLSIQSIRSDPNNWFKLFHEGVVFVELGRLDEAKTMFAKAKEILPNFVPVLQSTMDVWWWAVPEQLNNYRLALTKAGLEVTPQE